MDPPYGTNGPVYFNNFSKDELLNFINNLNCKWCLSYNGDSKLPYNSIDIIAGKSSFRKFSTDDKHCIIKEKLYFNE